MEYVYDFVLLLAWTGICVAFVYVMERIFESFGYRAKRVDEEPGDHVPPLPPG